MSTAFMGLTSETQLGSTHPEVVRLNNILKVYEKECFRLKESIESLEKINENCVASLKEGESNRASMAKQIRSLNEQIKFNKIASDGIAKKSATFEFEFTNLKEERKVLIENQILDRKRLVYLEQASNDDRSKLLREMHENDVLRRKNGVLEANVSALEKELRGVRQDLLIKIGKNESLTIENEQNRRVMREQSDEVLKLSQDMAIMTEEKRFLGEANLTQEQYLSEKTREAKDFEEENWRLRTELTCLSRSQSEKSLAFASYRPSTTAQTRTGTRGLKSRSNSVRDGTASNGFSLPEMDHHLGPPGIGASSSSSSGMSVETTGLSTRGDSRAASVGSRQASWTVSPISAPMKTVGSSASYENKLDFNSSAASVDSFSSSLPGGTVGGSSFSVGPMGGSDEDIGVYFAEPTSPGPKKVVLPSKVNVNNPTLRTKYLGSGLGFQNDFDNPMQKSGGGSAKQVLKKILEDFEKNK